MFWASDAVPARYGQICTCAGPLRAAIVLNILNCHPRRRTCVCYLVYTSTHTVCYHSVTAPESGVDVWCLFHACSGTRLVIHFGDMPCHGNKYHDHDMYIGDSLPNGDPNGWTCEEFLRTLTSQQVDYHFARIRYHTDKMVAIWKRDVFAHTRASTFEEHSVRFPSSFCNNPTVFSGY